MNNMNKKILAFIYNKKKNKFLILKTNGNEPEKHGKSHWFTTTGSVEKEESYEQAVKREIKEEINLDVKEIYNLKWGCRYIWQNQTHEELYFIAFVNSDKIKLDKVEVIDFKWLDINDFVKLIDWNLNKGELKSILNLGLKNKIDYPWIRIDDYTSQDIPKTIFVDKKDVTTLSWHKIDNFSEMKDVRQCYGICFNKKGQILIVKNKGKWFLPGGTPEKGETFEQTLIREIDEEADVEIENIKPLGYNKIEEIKEGKKSIFYQLRFTVNVAKIKKQTLDPATNTQFKRKFIDSKDFLAYTLWSRPGEEMIEDALIQRQTY
jgi:8-oxo-dGTP pyrophosphatase MutT (NUDIX family)